MVFALVDGYEGKDIPKSGAKLPLRKALAYVRDRVGVPRDMSYPAARQLRAHFNWIADGL